MLGWLKREAIVTLGMLGAAMTVLAELANVLPMAPWLAHLLALWQSLTRALWHPPLELLAVPLHPSLVAALTLAMFMTMIAVGARISGRLAGAPLAPIRFRWFDDQTWPSLAVFAALSVIFLLGQGGAAPPFLLFGSKEAGKYAFAITVTIGYFAGDFIGHREFHLRLVRLAVLVAVLVVLSAAWLAFAGLKAPIWHPPGVGSGVLYEQYDNHAYT